MLDKKESLKRLYDMPIEEMQKCICQALDDSGIEYSMDGAEISLSEFFESFHDDIKEHLNELKNINN